MSRLFDDASSEYLENTSAAVTAVPLSISAWFRTDDATVNQQILALENDATTDRFGLLIQQVSSNPKLVATVNSFNAEHATTLSANTWYHGMGCFASSTSRSVYLDGAGKVTNTDSATPSGIDLTSVGRWYRLTFTTNYWSGDLAEIGVWDVELTDAEVSVLAIGTSPLMVRPQNLVHYWPLIGRHSPEIDLISGIDLTLNNTPGTSEHPRIFYPRRTNVFTPAGGG